MDTSLWIDRLYSDSSLTDNLTDKEAEQLLTWGESKLSACTGEEEAGEVISRMRDLNRRVGEGEPFVSLFESLSSPPESDITSLDLP